MSEEHVRISTQDGQTLAGSWYAPGDVPAHTALVVHSGTGIPRHFYRRFATFAAARGFGVLTYDYRGIGDSAPVNLRKCTAVYRDWGQHDVPATIAWAQERLPGLPLAVVGHSTGGQQLGLAHNVQDIDAALFIAVSTGYWAGMPTKHKWFTWMLWHVVSPLARATIGHFPGKRLRLGEDLPAGVVVEWAAWCMEPTYLAAFFDDTGHRKSPDGRPFGPTYFGEAKFPISAYCFTDDEIATLVNVPPMISLFSGTVPDIHWFEPEDAGVKAIGHLGFFRKSVGRVLWQKSLDDLRDSAAKTRRSRG